MLIVGSQALKQNNNLSAIQPKDIDIIGTKEDVNTFLESKGWEITEVVEDSDRYYTVKTTGLPIECELTTHPHGKAMHTFGMKDAKNSYASNNFLYMLKMSHRYKKNSPHFLKTMRDIHFLRSKGVKIGNMDLFKEREKLTYDYGHPKLNVSKTDFFKGDGVQYVYDHDSIHEAIALGEAPAYKSYQKEGSEVLTSRDKFFSLDNKIRLHGVYEEACVLALERSQVPYDFKVNPSKSFKMALDKVCTSITSGWFREYAWENYWDVVQMYKTLGESDYIRKFQKNSNKLKPYEKPEVSLTY